MMAVISPWAMCRFIPSSARTSLSPKAYTLVTLSMSIIASPLLFCRLAAAAERASKRGRGLGPNNFHIVARFQVALDDDQVVHALAAGHVDTLQRASGIQPIDE